MISTNDFRVGLTIELDGEVWQVMEFQHVKPGKGAAFVRSKLRNLRNGNIQERTFRAGEKVPRAHVETRQMQYLYESGGEYTFMDKETYEQITLPRDTLGDAAAFLQDGMDVVMELHDERPISVQLPDTVEATIVEADAVVKGQTASSSYKPALLDNGVRIMVPPHISSGTKVVVDVYEQTYVRRAD